jgi:polar amino acid transport system substrate-binding protein
LKNFLGLPMKNLIRTLGLSVLLLLSGRVFAVESPPLTIVFMAGLEPLCWEENGKPRGQQPEIAEYVLSKLGIKANFLFLPWARAQAMVEAGDADLMMTTPTEARFAFAVFGKEMTTPNYWNVFIKKDNAALRAKANQFTKIADLKPYKIVDFLGNGWADAFLKESEGYSVFRTAKIEKVIEILAVGRADIVINSSTSVNWFLNKMELTEEIEELDLIAPGTRFHMTFQVSRKSPWIKRGLVKALDDELKKMKESGDWLKILKRYKDPYASGRPFKSLIATDAFYKDYDSYPSYNPAR